MSLTTVSMDENDIGSQHINGAQNINAFDIEIF